MLLNEMRVIEQLAKLHERVNNLEMQSPVAKLEKEIEMLKSLLSIRDEQLQTLMKEDCYRGCI